MWNVLSYFKIYNWHRTWQTTFETQLFRQHEETKGHKFQQNLPPLAKRQTALILTPVCDVYPDDAIWIRIQGAWWLAKSEIALSNFSSYIENVLSHHGYKLTGYCDDKAAWDIIILLAKWFRNQLKDRLADSPYYGIMVDETTDRLTSSLLIIYSWYRHNAPYVNASSLKMQAPCVHHGRCQH